MGRYPRIVLCPDRIRENASKVVELCRRANVEVAAVPKGVLAEPRTARAMIEGGCASFADSRLRNLKLLRREFPSVPRALLRIPMKSELEDVVRCADCSLVSMTESIEALEAECRLAKATHEALLMFDLGDRREGILEEELDAFVSTLRGCSRLRLRGVGVNFGCFSGVLPGVSALERLCAAREALESALGYDVPVCSGGSTSSLMLIERGELPAGVNQLRVGEAILLGRDVAWRRDIPWLRQDTAVLEAEVVEVRVRPTLPEGETGADAFGNVHTFEDRGRRLRAIVAVGRQDVPPEGLIPCDRGVTVLGASSDHMLLDVEEMDSPPRWGDVLRFFPGYSALLGLMTSPYVFKDFVHFSPSASYEGE
ncbi:MAG: alanine/ornithine racemase family PLP-dependent enzyme [Synergistaceae bacterium]|jgi:predicted amino acid racemase|nr:alanine/ornithine racemase family PLP-dependent enzyme [Synergistaceae bacterium]